MSNKPQGLACGEITELVLLNARKTVRMDTFLNNKKDFLRQLDGGPVRVYVIHTHDPLDYAAAYPHTLARIPSPAWLPANVELVAVPNAIYQQLWNSLPVLLPPTVAPANAQAADTEKIRRALQQLQPKSRAWVADAFFAVLKADGPPLLISPTRYVDPDKNDLYKMNAAAALAMHTDCQVRPSRHRMDGGNLLFGDGFVLAGADIWYHNRPQHADAAQVADFTERLRRQLDTEELVWIASQPNWVDPIVAPAGPLSIGLGILQPLFHIDLFVTPLGVQRVPGRTGLFQVILVGDYIGEFKIPNFADMLVPPPDDDEVNEIKKALNRVATQLAGRKIGGYPVHVERAPVFFAPIQLAGTLRYGPYSYCNCVVERRSEQVKRVYVPDYFTQHEIGRDAVCAYRKDFEKRLAALGFQARFVRGEYSDPRTYGLGALHCQVNVTRRKPYDLESPTPRRLGIVE
jgi:hypothetical protein